MLGIEKLTKNISFLEEKLNAQSLRLTNIEKLIEKHNLATDVGIIEVKELINNINFKQNFNPISTSPKVEISNDQSITDLLISIKENINYYLFFSKKK